MKQTLVLGGPGAGKTTRLLNVMDAALKRGVAPDEIAFVGFTNASADEARRRACERFGFSPKELPHFRTIHSHAFRALGLRRSEVIGEDHLNELADLTGELYTGEEFFDGPAMGKNADPLLTLDHYARTTMRPLETAWEDHGGKVEWHRCLRFSKAYADFKEDLGLVDFTDMLSRYVSDGGPIDVEVAIVDEAQDLTRLQWRAVNLAFKNAKELWVAGDDLQSVHHWAGSDDEHFLSLPYDREVLPKSHRLPIEIFNLAESVAARVERKYRKEWTHSGRSGSVEWVNQPEEADLSNGTWLLLARTRAQLAPLIQAAREQGVTYSVKGESSVKPSHLRAIVAHEALRAGKSIEGPEARAALEGAGRPFVGDESRHWTASELRYDARAIWHDALVRIPVEDREYYLSTMRRGDKLNATPRVRIETIHGAKGAEAQNVLLNTDLTWRTNEGFALDPDSEHRVFYVGLTRASESLRLLAPQSQYEYRM